MGGERSIKPIFNVQERKKEMMLINPYRFQSAVWTPPNAVLWYYGSLLSGSQWADRIGSNHGTFQDGTTADANGVACSATKYVTAASAGIETLVAGENVISASAWFKITDNNAQKYIISKGEYNTLNDLHLIEVYTNTSPHRLRSSVSNSIYKIADINITDATWTHIAVVYDKINSLYLLYVNTSLVHTSISGTYIEIPSNSKDLVMGKNADYIDDIILSTTAWSNDDVADIFNNSPATHK